MDEFLSRMKTDRVCFSECDQTNAFIRFLQYHLNHATVAAGHSRLSIAVCLSVWIHLYSV